MTEPDPNLNTPLPFVVPWPVPAARSQEGRYVRLVPLDPARDAVELFSISHAGAVRTDLWRYLPRGPFEDTSAMAAFLNEWSSRPDVCAFTVRHSQTDACLGTISIMSIRPEHGAAELGYIWYAPSAQRTEANTEACYLLLNHCFEDLRYRRMEWKCDALNAPSRAAALRLGFVFEGIFRQHMVVKGRSRDTAWFSMLDGEWPGRRANFERWLGGDRSVSLTKLNL